MPFRSSPPDQRIDRIARDVLYDPEFIAVLDRHVHTFGASDEGYPDGVVAAAVVYLMQDQLKSLAHDLIRAVDWRSRSTRPPRQMMADLLSISRQSLHKSLQLTAERYEPRDITRTRPKQRNDEPDGRPSIEEVLADAQGNAKAPAFVRKMLDEAGDQQAASSGKSTGHGQPA